MLRLALTLFALTTTAHAQTLLGHAALPADTFRVGPTSGAHIEAANGRAVLFVGKQPIQGFSSLQAAPGGDLWALTDNGYGSKANSPDFELCITLLGRDFKTARGGSGKLMVKDTIVLRDPNHKAGFPIVNEDSAERRLTGADFDPESLVLAPDDTFWIGEEFGPFLLHFSRDGRLLEAPFALEGIVSPDDPLGRAANIKSSKGFEGLSLSADKSALDGLLEGPVAGDDAKQLRIYRFDLASKTWDDKPRYYQMEDAKHSIGELEILPNGKYLVIERDSFQNAAARFKRIYEIDLDFTSGKGNLLLPKRERADLLNISDPDHLASSGVFRFPFQTIESVLPLDNDRVIVMNDNNYPFSSGRKSGVPEDTEAIVIRLKP